MKHFVLTLLIVLTTITPLARAGRAHIQQVSQDPYAAALVLNAANGETLFARHADKIIYPASVIKLMVLLVTLDYVEKGSITLDDMVPVTVEAYKMGGSQVYLDPKEQFSVNDMLYALMIQSANDAAVALATYVAGSKEHFVELMNQQAQHLGMKNTHFYSVHGLPPATGQHVDVSTARDLGKLALALAKQPLVFTYTGVKVRNFRGGQFVMRNHNHLLEKVEGCDGFKTGYFKAAGFSIIATAKRKGRRIIAIIMGSSDRKVRDAQATELLARGFAAVPVQGKSVIVPGTKQPPITANKNDLPPATNKRRPQAVKAADPATATATPWFVTTIKVVIGVAIVLLTLLIWKKRQKKNRFRQ